MKDRRKSQQKAMFALVLVCALVTALPVIAITILLLTHGLPAMTWEFLSQPPRMGMLEGGIMPAILGTIYLSVGTIALALPLGILGAIYLNEYAGVNRLTRLIRLAIVNLAGVPSVVFGLFGLGLFVMLMHFGTSLLAGCLTLALLVLPVIITTTEEALSAVPNSFREASYALGASKWQTIWRVVFPNALPGILTGAILGIGRASGETAPILFTAAAFYLPRLPRSIFDQVMALPYHLYVISTQVPNATPKIQWGTALTLLAVVFLMNLAAILLRTRLRSKRQW